MSSIGEDDFSFQSMEIFESCPTGELKLKLKAKGEGTFALVKNISQSSKEDDKFHESFKKKSKHKKSSKKKDKSLKMVKKKDKSREAAKKNNKSQEPTKKNDGSLETLKEKCKSPEMARKKIKIRESDEKKVICQESDNIKVIHRESDKKKVKYEESDKKKVKYEESDKKKVKYEELDKKKVKSKESDKKKVKSKESDKKKVKSRESDKKKVIPRKSDKRKHKSVETAKKSLKPQVLPIKEKNKKRHLWKIKLKEEQDKIIKRQKERVKKFQVAMKSLVPGRLSVEEFRWFLNTIRDNNKHILLVASPPPSIVQKAKWADECLARMKERKVSIIHGLRIPEFQMITRTRVRACRAIRDEFYEEIWAEKEALIKWRENMLVQVHRTVNDPTFFTDQHLKSDNNVDIYARMQESSGEHQMHIINFDFEDMCDSEKFDDRIYIWLLEVRDLFCIVLPDMDRAYVTRIVFDPCHRNLILIEGGMIIGGICFRMFPSQNFTEIVFVGVTYGKDDRGFGTHMMNQLKDYQMKYNVQKMVTYAAHEAIVFFEKQGFTKITPEHHSTYERHIKHYKGATLVECKLDEGVIYTETRELICRETRFIRRLINVMKKEMRAKTSKVASKKKDVEGKKDGKKKMRREEKLDKEEKLNKEKISKETVL